MKLVLAMTLSALLMLGCSKQEAVPVVEKKAEPVVPAAQAVSGPNLTQTPDVGKLDVVPVTTTAYAASPPAAVNEALKLAIQQVNGTVISSTSSSINAALDVSHIGVASGPGGASVAASVDSIKARGFAEQVVQRSRGSVTEFKVTSVTGPSTDNCVSAKTSMQQSSAASSARNSSSSSASSAAGAASSADGSSAAAAAAASATAASSSNSSSIHQSSSQAEITKCEPLYAVTIEAKIAKFKAPADAGKIKIVVAPLRGSKTTFNVAGEQVPAKEVLAAIRQQIIDGLSQTGRFSILDREFSAEMQGELDLIASGQTPNIEFAKLGQALSADLVWIGVVNEFSYERHVRQLRTSDRELVSYSGRWSMSQRLVNVATKQILQSTTLEGKAPGIGPTTLGTGVDKGSVMRSMQSDVVRLATEAIVLRTFPISIVERDGNTVVLSQGGKSLMPNSRFKVFLQGKEIKDPQTGQSLGNMETYCCDVVIDRVTPTLSYGRLENVATNLDAVMPGALQIRESVGVAALGTPTQGNANTAVDAPTAVANAASTVKTAPQVRDRPVAALPSAERSEPTERKSVLKEKDW